MKKTLSLLIGTAFALSTATTMAAEMTVKPYGDIQSPVLGNTIGLGGTLIDSSTGGQVIYDLRTDPAQLPPFDISKGHIHWGLSLKDEYNDSDVTLEDFALTDDDTLLIDFTTNMSTLSGPIDAEYVVIMFRHNDGTGNNFAEWYANNSVAITGKFNNGTYDAYVISETCDMAQTASTYGGLVFFNNSVAPQVRLAEIPAAPEPATATLSLLALLGLAARRRRK